GPFDNGPERNGLQISRNFVVFRGVYESGTVRPEVFRQKRSNGEYAGKGMKLSEKVTRIRLARGGRHALSAAGFLARSRSTNRKREKQSRLTSVYADASVDARKPVRRGPLAWFLR